MPTLVVELLSSTYEVFFQFANPGLLYQIVQLL